VQFGLNKPIAREGDQEEGEYRLCYKVFDILYVKGFRGEECNMMNLKLGDRRKVLKRVIKPIPMHLELVSAIESNNFEDIINEFD
jgi:DNA ligase-4